VALQYVAMGHFQTFGESNRMSGLPPEADIRVMHLMVCFGPEAVISRQASDDGEAGDRGDRLTHC